MDVREYGPVMVLKGMPGDSARPQRFTADDDVAYGVILVRATDMFGETVLMKGKCE